MTAEDRVKRPSYQWFPGDFKRDTGVQSCDFLVRSIWREMLDLMHDGEPYGHLAVGGRAITPTEVARMLGLSPRIVRKAFEELELKAICSRTETGVIYSRRMVKDEAVREARSAGGARSLDNPNVPRPRHQKGGVEDDSKDTRKDTGKDIGEDTNKARARDRACRAADANAVHTLSKEGDLSTLPGEGSGGRVVPLGVRHRKDVAWPGRPNVPGTLHMEFISKLGGDSDQADRELSTWYPTVAAAFEGQPIGDDDWKFWRLRFREYVGTTAPAGNGGRRPTEQRSAPDPNTDDWFAECQRLHDGECNGRLGHGTRMAVDAARAQR